MGASVSPVGPEVGADVGSLVTGDEEGALVVTGAADGALVTGALVGAAVVPGIEGD